jgi:hypothetical protein
MPKPISLTEIFSLLQNNSSVAEKTHFLFLQGTAMGFYPRPTPVQNKCLERGETLSYAAQAVVTLLGEQGERATDDNPLSYSSSSVDFINGPSLFGVEVGDRIARGVFLALLAVATGKERLQISAYSRGAVEAIMVMSELKRIKKALAEQKNLSLFEVLCAAPNEDNSNIAVAIKKLFKNAENDTQELREKLLKKLENLEINPFLIDPVPGGSRAKLTFLRWHSPRFYEEPDSTEYELLLCRDERTRCFSPIIPYGMQPLVIPGHHGTPNGNRYDHQKNEVSPTIAKRDTTTLQDLVLCKLFYFFNKCTKGRFNQENYRHVDLQHPQLDKVLNDFLSAEENDRQEQLLAQYQALKENDEAYRSFTKTCFSDYTLGKQQTKDGQRFVHFQAHNHKSMGEVLPTINKDFINQEHVMLYLRKSDLIYKITHGSPNSMINEITAILTKKIDKVQQVLSLSDPNQRFFNSEEERRFFFDNFSILLDTLSQNYLPNSHSQKVVPQVLGVIKEPFDILKRAKDLIALYTPEQNKDCKEFIDNLDNLIQKCLKDTVQTLYKDIGQQTITLRLQIEKLLATPEELGTVFRDFITKLCEDKEICDRLQTVIAKLDDPDRPPIDSIESLQDALAPVISQLGEASAEKLEKIKAEFLQPYFDAHQSSIDEYLSNLERLHNLTKDLHEDFPALQTLSNSKIEIAREQFHLQEVDLIRAGGSLLKAKGIDLRNKPECLTESFFNLIKQEAMRLGAPAPELQDLQLKYGKAQEVTRKLLETNKELKDKNVSLFQLAEERKIDLDSTRETSEKLQKENARLLDLVEQTQKEKANLLDLAKRYEVDIGRAHETSEEIKRNSEKIIRKLEEDLKLANQALSQNTAVNDKKIGELQVLLSTLRATLAEKNQTISRLQLKEERDKASLIQDKLLPLTNKYLNHLLGEALKYNPDLSPNIDGLPALPDLSSAKKEAYEKVRSKYNLVLSLKNTLKYTENNPLPSERVAGFSEALIAANTLKTHRDSMFHRYMIACFSILGIVLTGIVPGVASLLIYSAVKGKGVLSFFNTRGEEYITECNQNLALTAPSA